MIECTELEWTGVSHVSRATRQAIQRQDRTPTPLFS